MGGASWGENRGDCARTRTHTHNEDMFHAGVTRPELIVDSISFMD